MAKGKKKSAAPKGIPVIVYEPALPAAERPAGRGMRPFTLSADTQLWHPEAGFFGGGLSRRVGDVMPETLQKHLADFLAKIGTALDKVPTALAGYRLEEIEIEVEVSAEGQVGLLGTGGKLGGKGSLTLRLKRPPAGA